MKDRPKPSRATVLHNLIEEILARDDGHIPTNIEGTDTYFNNIEDLANALLLRWHTRLVASLERGLVDDPEDRREAVIEAWRHASRIYSGVRRVIDEMAEDPPTDVVAHAVLATARNDWAAMAIAAGLASGIDELGARVGQRLELDAHDATSQNRARPTSLQRDHCSARSKQRSSAKKSPRKHGAIPPPLAKPAAATARHAERRPRIRYTGGTNGGPTSTFAQVSMGQSVSTTTFKSGVSLTCG